MMKHLRTLLQLKQLKNINNKCNNYNFYYYHYNYNNVVISTLSVRFSSFAFSTGLSGKKICKYFVFSLLIFCVILNKKLVTWLTWEFTHRYFTHRLAHSSLPCERWRQKQRGWRASDQRTGYTLISWSSCHKTANRKRHSRIITTIPPQTINVTQITGCLQIWLNEIPWVYQSL